MARKQRRRTAANRPRPRPAAPNQPQAQPQAQPPMTGAAPAMSMAAPETAAARPAGPPRVGGDQALVRAVEMSLAPAAPTRKGGRIVLPESTDAAIPLDRVPYFTSDLVRVAITGVAMIVLLVVAALLVIPAVVK